MEINPNLALHSYEFFDKIISNRHSSHSSKVLALVEYINNLIVQISDEERLLLPNMFARISLLAEKYQLSRAQRWRLNKLSQHTEYEAKQGEVSSEQLGQALKTSCLFIYGISKKNIPPHLIKLFPETDGVEYQESNSLIGNERLDTARAFVIDCQIEPQNELEHHFILSAYLETSNRVGDNVKIRCNVGGYNEHLAHTVRLINTEFKNKIMINMVDILVNENGEYLPKFIVVEPDYLVDVSTIAECFGNEGLFTKGYIVKKFMQSESTLAITIGNAANFFLDELILDENANFAETFKKLFRTDAARFALADDSFIRELHSKSQIHFSNLRVLVSQTLSEQKIDKNNAVLEPAFYSKDYGIQGRLDFWDYDPQKGAANIIELKSGKLFAPNRYGIINSHYVQTLLYGMLTRSVFGAKLEAKKFIYYSGIEKDNLKYAPTVVFQEYEAMNARNELIVWEKKLAELDNLDLDNQNFLDALCYGLPKLPPFTKSDFELFEGQMSSLQGLERAYFISFVAFIAKEHQLARIGLANDNSINGIASLWLSSLEEKEENFSIMQGLRMYKYELIEDKLQLVFHKTAQTQPLANFREGDIVVLYPKTRPEDTVMNHQIFKASIAALSSEQVIVRLNYKQSNMQIFAQYGFWALEADMLDKSYTTLYQSLFGFFSHNKPFQRQLILSQRPPTQNLNADIEQIKARLRAQEPQLSEEQQDILSKIIISKEYFLLIGPPGTGKTKFMLAQLVAYLSKWGEISQTNNPNQQKHQILLLAYTNRAVDEICEAIHHFAQGQYIRMGTGTSVDKRFRNELFSQKTAHAQRRKELIEIVEAHHIIVATISHVANHPEVLKLKHFDTAIIDEASQVLEPMLVGMLGKFKRFVLVGDNKQLPAVVLQNKEQSKTQSPLLHEIGLHNRRNSLFERMLKQAQQHNWHWAWAALSQQGRMHSDINQFASQNFYEGQLQPFLSWQNQPLNYPILPDNELAHILAARRVCFFPSRANKNKHTNKANEHEAITIAETMVAFAELYQANGLTLDPQAVGIICPYRAQIAQIKAKLTEAQQAHPQLNIDFERCTIDTVERYQGGTKSIVLLSLCLNNPNQLKTLVSLDDTETVDRKLNVALTRAQHHLVIIGNPQIMVLDKYYKKLLDWAKM